MESHKPLWIYDKDAAEPMAKKLMAEWIKYDWLHWVFVKTAFVPEEKYVKKQDEMLRFLAQFADLRRQDVALEDTFMHVTNAYECDDCEDYYPDIVFRGYREADLGLRAHWDGVDAMFASGFTRARGYLTIEQSLYRPAIVSVYRNFACEDGAPIPQDSYRIRVLDAEKSPHCGDISEIRKNGSAGIIKKVNNDMAGSLHRLAGVK